MDERQVQLSDRSRDHGVWGELHPTSSRGLEAAGSREHEVLLAEGYYRCPHCRRADLHERAAVPARMR